MNVNFTSVFLQKPVIGMIHLLPLPGAPAYGGSIREIEAAAFADLRALAKGGADAFLVENFSDVPYACELTPEAFAVMSGITAKLAAASALPFGVNIQANQTQLEWALAYASDAAFIRVEAFVENRLGSFGMARAAAPTLTRQAAQFPANTMIFADVHSKHTYAVTAEQTTALCVAEAREAGAAALIATGLLTGQKPSKAEVTEMKRLGGGLPVLLGSGISAENADDFFAVADGAIVGSAIKVDGDVRKRIDESRVRALVAAIHPERRRL